MDFSGRHNFDFVIETFVWHRWQFVIIGFCWQRQQFIINWRFDPEVRVGFYKCLAYMLHDIQVLLFATYIVSCGIQSM